MLAALDTREGNHPQQTAPAQPPSLTRQPPAAGTTARLSSSRDCPGPRLGQPWQRGSSQNSWRGAGALSTELWHRARLAKSPCSSPAPQDGPASPPLQDTVAWCQWDSFQCLCGIPAVAAHQVTLHSSHGVTEHPELEGIHRNNGVQQPAPPQEGVSCWKSLPGGG